MQPYSVVLRYEVEVEIEDIIADDETDAIKQARETAESNFEFYISNKKFKCVLDVEEIDC